MTIEKKISPGDLVSWSLILIGFAVGYASLRATASQALETANEAKVKAEQALEQFHSVDKRLEGIQVTLQNVNTKVDEIRRDFKANKLATSQ